MKKEDLIFPLTAEAYIAYQEAGAGWEFGKNMREAIEVWLPVFNDSYEKGKCGDRQALLDSIKSLDECISRSKDEPILHDFLSVCKMWVCYAWTRGNDDARKAVGT